MRTARSIALAALVGCATIVPAGETLARELEVGAKAPNFKLPGIDGKPFELTSLKGRKNVVLVFSRGHWCPFCSGHMQQLQKNYEAMTKLDAEVVVVFREDGVEGLEKSRTQARAEFVLLADEASKHTKRYSPVGYATYVLDKQGVIRAVLPGTKADRPSATDILAELRNLPTE